VITNILGDHARRLPFLLCLVFVAVTARAAGVKGFVIPLDSSGPQISAQLWTPCASPPGPIRVSRGSIQLTIRGVKDCASSSKQLPLIVISHGMLEDMFSHHDTAEYLADAGFAVVTFNHPLDSGSSAKDDIDNITSFLARPIDIKRVISFVLSTSQAPADIDSGRIGFFGFSRGGYTGLILAGAIPNFHALLFPCPEEILMCKQLRDNNIPDHGSGFEPRIKAFVIADPISFFPDKSSLQKVTAPIQLWSSERGGMGVRPEDVASLEGNLPNTPEFHRPANSVHFSFLFPCTDEEAKVMSFQCTDAPGFNRADFHKTLNAQILEFFRKNLPSDKAGSSLRRK
jgi:predicted dienelactone hydrolase